MYYENMRFGDYADIELSIAEMDRIYQYAKHRFIRTARSKREIAEPWINYSSEDLYDRLEEIWNKRKDSDQKEEWLYDLIIQSVVLVLSLRYEKYNKPLDSQS